MFHHEHMLYDTIDLPKTANKRLHVLKETLTPPHKTISNQRCFFLFFLTTQPPLSNEDVDYVTIYHSNPLQTQLSFWIINYHLICSVLKISNTLFAIFYYTSSCHRTFCICIGIVIREMLVFKNKQGRWMMTCGDTSWNKQYYFNDLNSKVFFFCFLKYSLSSKYSCESDPIYLSPIMPGNCVILIRCIVFKQTKYSVMFCLNKPPSLLCFEWT